MWGNLLAIKQDKASKNLFTRTFSPLQNRVLNKSKKSWGLSPTRLRKTEENWEGGKCGIHFQHLYPKPDSLPIPTEKDYHSQRRQTGRWKPLPPQKRKQNLASETGLCLKRGLGDCLFVGTGARDIQIASSVQPGQAEANASPPTTPGSSKPTEGEGQQQHRVTALK